MSKSGIILLKTVFDRACLTVTKKSNFEKVVL